MANAAATVFCMPITIDSVKRTSVDGIVNGVEVRNFVDNLSSQTRNQITLVSATSMRVSVHLFSHRQVFPWPWTSPSWPFQV
jgi:hypothetical protein